MSALLKIRAGRDGMSAIERRIADFLLENAQLLRDYSSQQLADALGVSQSSVVKFSQRLGFKGYPDLKFSIGESLARGDASPVAAATVADAGDPHALLADALWQAKSAAEAETRSLNPPDRIDAVAAALRGAGTVFVAGLGPDGLHARAFAMQLSLLGVPAVHHFDPVMLPAAISRAGARDVLVVFSEYGRQASLCRVARLFRERHGKVVAVTRHGANPLRAHADLPLLVAAHDERVHVEPLLYRSALLQLLDLVTLVLCDDPRRLRLLDANLERIRPMLET
jgi:DNA-binding MurR/RpiR family transcriptional regulator